MVRAIGSKWKQFGAIGSKWEIEQILQYEQIAENVKKADNLEGAAGTAIAGKHGYRACG